jgi:DNA-binding response OmpR family regulator
MGGGRLPTKPFSFTDFGPHPRNKRADRKTRSIPIEVESLELDTLAYTETGRQMRWPFQTKEFTLLEYLMRNAGKIMTKNQIINHVWDYDADILPNTVEVYIVTSARKSTSFQR